MRVLGFPQFAEAGHQIGMHCFSTEKCIHRYAVVAGEHLNFLNAHAAPTLLNGYQSGARHADDLGCVILPDVCVFPRYS